MFQIIMPAYNVEKWIPLGINMLKLQTYHNFKCWIIDDMSTDRSFDVITNLIKDDNRFTLFSNKKNIGSSLENFVFGFKAAKPVEEDVLIFHDGDDWLSSVFVLEYLNELYKLNNYWMTYGTYQVYPTGEIGLHHCKEVPNWVFENNSFREYEHVFSHLRTHKAFLQYELANGDLINPETGKIFAEANDCAYLFPLLELCGKKERVGFVKEVLLILNRENELNDAKINMNLQKHNEQIIRNMKKRNSLIR